MRVLSGSLSEVLVQLHSWFGVVSLLIVPLVSGASAFPEFPDDADKASLLQAVSRQQEIFKRGGTKSLRLADREVAADQLRATNEAFSELVSESFGLPEFERKLAERFEWIDVPEGHVTGYFLPKLAARRQRTEAFRFPLYRKPPDFQAPYFSRAEIEDGEAIASRSLEIAWLDDEFARYLLMVQGSGVLKFEDEEVFVNFAGGNGRPYTSLGKQLVAEGRISQAQISIPAIKAYFDAHPDELHAHLLRNESYVFFKLAPTGPFGVSGVALTPGRSIATDKSISPSGAIAHLRFGSHARFVCDQDTGSAIKGLGRVDVYWGAGPDAELMAGTLNASASLRYLLLKSSAGN